MTARSSSGENRWVQPIIVDKASTHEAAIAAAAQASVLVRFSGMESDAYPLSHYDEWLSGPFTKSVRRASAAQMSGLIQFWAKETGIPYAVVEIDGSVAIAFPPMLYDAMPKQIAKFQVHGTDFPRFGEVPDTGPAWTRVLVNDDLTTGKAAAAAAHALWAWMLRVMLSSDSADRDLIDAWVAAKCPFVLNLATPEFIDEIIDSALPGRAIAIRDAGLTEVDPGTVTALAVTALTGS